MIRLHFKKNSAFRRTSFTWRDDFQSNRTSGALGDLGIHLIDLLWFYLRVILERIPFELKSKQMLRKRKQTSFVDDYAEVYGQLENKVFVNITTSKSSFPDDCGFSIEVIGTKKNISILLKSQINIYSLMDWKT